MKPWAMDGICVKLTIRGLLGGHSGTEIDKDVPMQMLF